MGKVTIKDVAREAGVSISTVSNALNNVDVLVPATKAHILAVAERLNYIPNLNGKLLKASESKMLGFFTTSVSGPYFYVLVEAMARHCEKLGYGLNIVVAKDKRAILNNILGQRLDGVLIFEELLIDEKDVAMMEKAQVKAVFLDRVLENETMGSVIFDSYAAGYDATKYLISLGHKKIAYISGVDTMYDSVQRKEGYLAALREHQIPFDESYILQGFFEEEGTYNAVKSFVHSHPETLPHAFLAGNDVSAIGCIKALKSQGYQVPEDVSVMGFDDINLAEYFSPPLTTVKNQIARQGILAVDHLVKLIKNEEKGRIQKLQGEIIVRRSSALKVDQTIGR
ncbi:LacI family DNA-binding transcriptional regulator [Fictibacillus phosphorivorans]|uniref:LacI family DNA-binding transcriptional regulator n=1 Tax=Fictibacillus phosphorivorans TaxID=1221500 RepID=UPI00204148FF|nr:LacI family DNA-binding transcriptional regulator [Fictibacillus phosphorivorans]MCM3717728.1 LacI family transcriptional regulator [Fictibacillus phosphorivorans]MCM3775628.1 LacI family transcriptional regulator [Fictibacillus phosphorivorans]